MFNHQFINDPIAGLGLIWSFGKETGKKIEP
jgi:hypothetical protein